MKHEGGPYSAGPTCPGVNRAHGQPSFTAHRCGQNERRRAALWSSPAVYSCPAAMCCLERAGRTIVRGPAGAFPTLDPLPDAGHS